MRVVPAKSLLPAKTPPTKLWQAGNRTETLNTQHSSDHSTDGTHTHTATKGILCTHKGTRGSYTRVRDTNTHGHTNQLHKRFVIGLRGA